MEQPRIEVYGVKKMKKKLLKKLSVREISKQELKGIGNANLEWLAGKSIHSAELELVDIIIVMIPNLAAVLALVAIHSLMESMSFWYGLLGMLLTAILFLFPCAYLLKVVYRHEKLFFLRWKRSPFYEQNSALIRAELERRIRGK